MTPSDVRKEYLASRVSAATPMELTRMLYEGAIQSVEDALVAHRAGDILGRGNAVTKTVQILGELRFSLRREVNPQYCDTLAGLYGYLQRRSIQAHAEKSESMLREVQGLIETLLEGWIGAMNNLSGKQNGEPEAVQTAPSAGASGGSAAAVSASNPYSREPHWSEPYSSELGALQNRSWQF
jgi:flagellar secretion chaperone FliS